ncbi:MEKHLA domain-containing protein [Dyadobacter sp. 676]|uniref:MEKHLA domain-containing protein n=1 Tax=Dyadobacter sp. 676 TaxID=3088362 RepID=A0AAU8FU67_9BACT
MAPVQNDISIRQISDCFHQLAGRPLYAPPGISDVYRWLHEEAPYAILAHNAEADPCFIYANNYALSCFKYSPDEILSVHSRLSASAQDRPQRAAMLEIVVRDGIVYNYSGPRVDKFGNSFMIYDGAVWQLRSAAGEIWGQAALFWTEKDRRPEWY